MRTANDSQTKGLDSSGQTAETAATSSDTAEALFQMELTAAEKQLVEERRARIAAELDLAARRRVITRLVAELLAWQYQPFLTGPIIQTRELGFSDVVNRFWEESEVVRQERPRDRWPHIAVAEWAKLAIDIASNVNSRSLHMSNMQAGLPAGDY